MFGDVVARYTMNESVKDEITVPIVYEGRAAKVLLDNRKLQEIEYYYAQCADDGASDYQIEQSKQANTQMNVILGDPGRIKTLAADFVKHYESRVSEGATVTGKAMFVSASRQIAYDFYRALIALRPAWAEAKACDAAATLTDQERNNIKPMARLNMIMTRAPNDSEELYAMLGNKGHRKELDRQFKNEKSNFKIAIVVDMWLTGFDVPFLDTIYIDKPIQRHNLIQTISRVNRKFAGKAKGLVVDYIGIKRQMDQALAQYAAANHTNVAEIDESIGVVKDQLDLLAKLFYQFDMARYFSGTPLAKLACLNAAAEFVQTTAKIEKRFMSLVKRLKAAYDICCGSDDFSQSERDHIHFYLAVRSIVFKLTKGNAPDATQMNDRVQEMIKDALHSDGVADIFKMADDQSKEIDIFADDYLAKIANIKLPNTKIKLLQQLLAKAIDDFKKINKMKGLDFSKKLQALVDKYNERQEGDSLVSDVLEDFADKIIALLDDLKQEKASSSKLGIGIEEKAFYDILKTLAVNYDFTYPEDKLLTLAKAVKKVVDDQSRFTDWNKRDDIKAELKTTLILLLDEHKYPPVSRDEVYEEIFEQAENFKTHQPA